MKSFFKNILSTILGILLSFFIVIIVIVSVIAYGFSSVDSNKKITIKNNSVLKIDLSSLKVMERTNNNPLNNLGSSGEMNKSIELKQVLDNIKKAATDEKIDAIFIESPSVNAGLSQIEEIRNQLLEFKKSGKKIIAYSEVYSQVAYYLSSIANKIYLHPEGIVELKGLSAEQIFFTGLFKKLDIEMQIIRHGKFKSAVEPFTLKKMSKENREQMSMLLNSFSKNIMDSIASQRNFSFKKIMQDANQLNLNSAINCLNENYVDGLIYQDQVEEELLRITETEKLNIVDLIKYTKTPDKKSISKDKIAIIYATGSINSGKGDEESIGSKTTSAAIKKARKDKNIKAIVLRVNSGGGSALASDVILREAILAKKEKPFVVSMGDYAASGGYYIACAADSIVANPTTLTGSIGVFGMIPNMKNFYKNKLGITFDTVNTAKYADMGINRALTDYERKKIQESVEGIYDSFITHVSNGRMMTKNEVDNIGQGRVWTGYDAKNIGLIDVYGGIYKAIEIAALLSKIEDYRIVSMPEKKDPFEDILSNFSENNSNFSKLILNKLGFISNKTNSIEDIMSYDHIQARIPYEIDLK